MRKLFKPLVGGYPQSPGKGRHRWAYSFSLFRLLQFWGKQPIDVGLGGQDLLHFFLGGVLCIGFFLFSQQIGILGMQRFYGGELLLEALRNIQIGQSASGM